MAKSKVVISLTGLLDDRFSIVENKNAPFGFYIKFKGMLFDPDITLHEVLDDNITSAEAADCFEADGYTDSGFSNVQGNIIEV